MSQKYYDFTHIFGEEIEDLLIKLKDLITTNKITENLPDNAKKEIKSINNKIEDPDFSVIDGGDYSTNSSLGS